MLFNSVRIHVHNFVGMFDHLYNPIYSKMKNKLVGVIIHAIGKRNPYTVDFLAIVFMFVL